MIRIPGSEGRIMVLDGERFGIIEADGTDRTVSGKEAKASLIGGLAALAGGLAVVAGAIATAPVSGPIAAVGGMAVGAGGAAAAHGSRFS